MSIALTNSTNFTGGANGGTTSAVNMTGADFLVMCISGYAAQLPTSVTDSSNNTWVQAALSAHGSGNSYAAIYYVAKPTVSASQTFTVVTSTGYTAFTVMGFSGVSKTSPLDKTNSNNSTSAGSLQPGSITPTQNGELIISALAWGGSISNLSINDSFTLQANVPFTSSQNEGEGAAYFVQSTAAAINPTWSWTTSQECGAAVASFFALGAAVVTNEIKSGSDYAPPYLDSSRTVKIGTGFGTAIEG